jgi:anti-anti-sigma factor
MQSLGELSLSPLLCVQAASRILVDGATGMAQTAERWELDIERGPDWLFIRPHGLPQSFRQRRESDGPSGAVRPADLHDVSPPHFAEAPELADEVWSLVERNFTRRLVLELDGINYLSSTLIGQLMRLVKRMSSQEGLLRICGLSADNRAVLDQCRLSARLPCYKDRVDAVMASHPAKPR